LARAEEILRVRYYLFKRVNETVEERLQSWSSLAYPLRSETEFLEGDLQQMIALMPLPLVEEEAAMVSAALDNYLMPQRNLCDQLCLWIADGCYEATGRELATGRDRRMTKWREVQGALSDVGAIKWGSYVELGPFQIRSLAAASLLDGRWIDLRLLEMAEFASLLVSSGYRLQAPPGAHPLEPMLFLSGSGLPASERNLLAIAIEAERRLRDFKGMRQNVCGRVCVDFDDYRNWTGRSVAGELNRMWGIDVNHWNRWLDSLGGEGRAEIAGIKLYRLKAPFSSNDFVVCKDELELAHRSEIRWRLQEKVRGTGVGRSQVREGVSAGLIAVLTLRKLVKRTERLFGGHTVIFKESEEQLEQQTVFWKALARRFNLTGPASVEEGDRDESETAGSQIDLDAARLKAESQSEILFNTIIDLAKANAWQSLGRRGDAKKILSEFLAKNIPPSADGMQAAPKPKPPRQPRRTTWEEMLAYADESERAMKAEDEKKSEEE
jgi:hypothetical protein